MSLSIIGGIKLPKLNISDCEFVYLDHAHDVFKMPNFSLEELDFETFVNILKESDIYVDSTKIYSIFSPLKDSINKLIIDCSICDSFDLKNVFILEKRIDELFAGIKLISKVLGLINIDFVISNNLSKYYASIDVFCKSSGVNLKKVKSLYPQNNKALLYRTITGRSDNYSPLSTKCLILDAHTICDIYNTFVKCYKQNENIITIKKNDKFKIISCAKSITYNDLLCHLGIDCENSLLYSGNLYNARLIENLDDNITSDIHSLFLSDNLLKKTFKDIKLNQCINCGKCYQICPVCLHPLMMAKSGNFANKTSIRKYDSGRCIKCNLCSYICPVGIDLSSQIYSNMEDSNEQ